MSGKSRWYRVLSTVLSSPKVVADDTTLPVLDPGRGRTKTGRLCCYAVDNRPWSGPGRPAASYAYSEDRKGEHPATHLNGFRGLLQVDGYAGFGGLVTETADEGPTLAFCWAHVRRGFYDLAKAKAPIAIETLQRIGALYEIEARVRGKTAAERLAVRQAESKLLVDALRTWFDTQIAKLPARGPMAEAIRYALNHWDGLRRFLEDGRIEIDSNGIERAMHPVALSRKNCLFAGSNSGGENWTCLVSLIETCKLNGVYPQAYFTDPLTRLVNGWPQNGIDELMPWQWATKQPL